LSEAGCDALFTPTVKEMYPTPPLLTVTVADLDAGLCGRSRPGHFAGVATVVTKLFNIVQPDMAFFGQKDGQQITVIRRLVMDLNLPIEIVAVPTVREASGLALSSRNVYLTPEDREHATVLSRALREAEATLQAGQMEAEAILADIQSRIANESGVRLDYAEIVDAQTLHPIAGTILRDVMIAVAAYVGKARLIDNVVVSVGAKTQEERA
jgi:pantoate--beta-alanine ligase